MVALEPRLQVISDEPPAPARRCKDADGAPTICGEDTAAWIINLRTWGRSMQFQLKEIVGLQPKEKP
jgi:hypothetical protein